MKISRKKPYITSSVTTVKSSSIKGFSRFTVTDEQRVEATPKGGLRVRFPQGVPKNQVLCGFPAFPSANNFHLVLAKELANTAAPIGADFVILQSHLLIRFSCRSGFSANKLRFISKLERTHTFFQKV